MTRDRVAAVARTDVGVKRQTNEDACFADAERQLFVVADGMGGHAAGEVASQLAVAAFRQAYDALGSILSIQQRLEEAVQESCKEVYNNAKEHPERRGMGTTFSALAVVDGRGYIAHVGDSRVYLMRERQLHQLTEDHSLRNEAVRKKLMTPEEVERTGKQDALTRAVGVYSNVEVDTFEFEMVAGDTLLLCSDGLHRYFKDQPLELLLDDEPLEQLADRLVTYANEQGGEDNVSVVLVHVPGSLAAQYSEAEEIKLRISSLRGMPFFRHLTYRELIAVLNRTRMLVVDAGQRIVEEGESDGSLFIVLSGTVRVHQGPTDMAMINQGEHFGEMALIDNAPRSASVTSLSESRLLQLDRHEFIEILRREQKLAIKLLVGFVGVLSRRLRATSRDLQEARTSAVDTMYDSLGIVEDLS